MKHKATTRNAAAVCPYMLRTSCKLLYWHIIVTLFWQPNTTKKTTAAAAAAAKRKQRKHGVQSYLDTSYGTICEWLHCTTDNMTLDNLCLYQIQVTKFSRKHQSQSCISTPHIILRMYHPTVFFFTMVCISFVLCFKGPIKSPSAAYPLP